MRLKKYINKNLSQLMLSEFFGRLLLWLRIPVLLVLVPKDLFGLLALIIGTEVLSSQATANTSVKLLLSERISIIQGIQGVLVCSPLILGIAFLLPSFTTAVITFNQSLVLFGAGIAGSLNHFFLYFLRINRPSLFAMARVISSFLIFVGTVLILPLNWEWIFPLNFFILIIMAYILVRGGEFSGDRDNSESIRWSRYLYKIPFFCLNSFYKTFSQNGVRLVVSFILGITHVADFALHSSLAGGVIFGYAVVLMLVEPRITKSNSELGKTGKLRLVHLSWILGFCISVVYLTIIFWFSHTQWAINLGVSYHIDIMLFTILVLALLVSFVSTILSGFLLGLGEVSNFVFHPLICISGFVASFTLIIDMDSLLDVGSSLLVGELLGLVFLLYRVCFVRSPNNPKAL